MKDNYDASQLPDVKLNCNQLRIVELEKALKEKILEADTMRQHHKNAEAEVAELKTQRDRLVELLDEKDKLIAEYFAEYDCPVGSVGKYCTNSEVEQNCECHGGDYNEAHCPESTVCWLAILKSRRAENL